MTSKTKTARAFDAAEFLRTPRMMADFLSDAVESGDARVIAAALGAIARARGMTQLARETGLTREALYRALSENGNPEFSTVVKVVNALNLRLSVIPTEDVR